MRKILGRIVLLCLACVLCMQGLCLAEEEEDKKENWVEYFAQNDSNIFYVDTNSIKMREYNGRKYVEATLRRKEKYFESIPFVGGFWNQKTTGKWHDIYDIGQGKVIDLEWEDKRRNPSKGTMDISSIPNGMIFEDPEKRLLEWVASNYPALIDEIMQYNHDTVFRYTTEGVNYTVSRNTDGIGGTYKIQSEDGLMGVAFDYNPNTNTFLMYNLDEEKPYSSQKYTSLATMARNSTDPYDDWNGNYTRNSDGVFVHYITENNQRHIFHWETDGLLTFLRLHGYKYL